MVMAAAVEKGSIATPVGTVAMPLWQFGACFDNPQRKTHP